MNSLAEQSMACQSKAISLGALVPLQTEILKSASWDPFILRKLQGYTPKHLKDIGPKQNPFSPWDKNLELYKLDHHILLLNKYPVEPGHLLLITKDWKPQNGWLSESDWQALREVWQMQGGLWFFNSAPEAGASQPHRHLQLLPRAKGQTICPEAEKFEANAVAKMSSWPWQVGLKATPKNELPSLDFLIKTYAELAEAYGIGNANKDKIPLLPYNLLISNKWFVLIPRTKEGHQGFSLNALGYAGFLLATAESNLDWLHKYGPSELLAEAAISAK